MRRSTHYLLVLFAVLLSFAPKAYGQIYPAAAFPSQMGPCSIYFDDFYAAMNPKLRVMLQLNDLTTPTRDVYLKVRITGPGVNIISTPGVRPLSPITLISGVPSDLIGSDLAPVFDFNALTFGGISRASLEGNGRLPEGSYAVCFTIMDYAMNVPLSQESCIQMQLALSDPPQIISPACGSVVTQIDPPNFLFNWMLTNSNSLVDLGNINYQIDLYEITPNNTSPQNAILNNQALPVWQSGLLNMYTYNYGITDPVLEVGKRYIYTVHAIENYERTQIKNNGYSAPCWFYYGYPEGGTIQLFRPDSNYQLRISDIGLFSWKRPSNAIPDQYVTYDYKVAKIEAGQTPEAALSDNVPFDEYTVPATKNVNVNYTMPQEVLNDLDKMKPYAWQITGRTGSQTVARSKVSTFIGPPYLDEFYAANFLIEVVSLTSFDTTDYTISGIGRVKLKDSPEMPEFAFHDVRIETAGNNLWIMVEGYIEDDITLSKYDISPKTITSNGLLGFQPERIFIDKDHLRLGGHCSWQVPVVAATTGLPVIRTEYVKMDLTSLTYQLAFEQPIKLENNYTIPLLEPYGFNLLIDHTSTLVVYQSKYELSLEGFAELPEMVADMQGSTVLVPYRNQKQVNFMEEQGLVNRPEKIDFLTNADFALRGEHYYIDLSESVSPGDKSEDSTWKGVYYQTARLTVPQEGEESNQLSCDQEIELFLTNTATDSSIVYIDGTGLNFKSRLLFSGLDSLKFNTFPSTEAYLNVDITENFLNSGSVKGDITIPLVDTARLFAYTVPLTSFGFQLGNIDESLVNFNFVFNAGGTEEERVNMKITRAVFKANNHIEMDMDANWPHFHASLQNLQSLCAWGNGNIGFDIPNGAAALNSQAVAKSGDYAMVIDYIGCGRDRNAYAFGLSAKMNMAENIAGESGAPVVNAYSMYINPLLSGVFNGTGTGPESMLPGFNATGDSSGVSQATIANATNLSNDLTDLSDNLGIDPMDTLSLGNDNPNVLISEGTYAKLQYIIEVAEIFVKYIDSAKAQKAVDYITVAKQALNSDMVKGAVNKDPKEYLQDIMISCLDDLIKRTTQPITKATLKATGKFRDLVEDNVTDPVNNKINTVLTKVFDKISEQVLASIDDPQAKALVTTILNDTKQSLKTQINNSISNSIEENVTSKITDFIEIALVKQVTDYIAGEIRYMGMELIQNGANANINMDHVVNNAESLFENMGDTLVSGIKSVSMQNIVKTAESLVDDALTGIDWDQILDDILTSAVNGGIGLAASELMGNAMNSLGGEAFGALMKNVSFDFSNLGEKLQSGDLSGIVKFDPTNITIKTTACEVHGQLSHKKDDPVYGDHWRAQVDVRLLKPEKLKDVAISALFITGKTSFSAPLSANFIPPIDTTDPQAVADYQASLEASYADTSKYSFWFASLAVSGLQVPLSPMPLFLTGIEGFAYHHMQKDSPTAFPQPCRLNKLGLGVGFDFIDSPGSGKFVKLHLQLEVIINEGAWAMEMYTKANVGNKGGASSMLPPLATAVGIIGYYSAIKTLKGEIVVTFNTSPVLCAGGTIKFKFDGYAGTWYVSAGTQEKPIFAKLLCKDWLSITTFVEAQNSGFKAGLNLNIDIQAKSPWADFGVVKVRGTAAFYIKLDAYVDLAFEPEFKLMEAYVYVAVGASIGIDYDTELGDEQHFTIAGIALAGHVHYKAAPEGNINGGLSGTVTVLGISCSMNMNVNYDLGNQSDNS